MAYLNKKDLKIFFFLFNCPLRKSEKHNEERNVRKYIEGKIDSIFFTAYHSLVVYHIFDFKKTHLFLFLRVNIALTFSQVQVLLFNP